MRFVSLRAAREFKALVHAPALRAGVRLCICDLRQTRTTLPGEVRPGASLRLQFGACCPDWGDAVVTAVRGDEATILVEGTEWRLQRSDMPSAARKPGIRSEDWYVR